jgi:predicted Fe-S protein YdhL (DUF1289 family)
MSRGIAGIILTMLLFGCGPTQQERQSAWMRAFQAEQDAVYQKWETDVAQRQFATNTAAVRDLKARYENVYSRWTLPMDLLNQALLSYAVALATRVDRGAIAREEAIRLCDGLKVDIDAGRSALARSATSDRRDAAAREWWGRFWGEHQVTYQATPANPIRCPILPGEGDGSTVLCE